ncbi:MULTISPECIES: monovalent cation/H+ antiporter complex subunit F [Actinomycetes]|uniref:Sodium:proton antiporter n=2 Tax=Actinomycetes TaxID=1760 RepID=A0ABP6M2R7_9MICC|nr:monovalent cation/H+ antiporter complex subunit F [Nesterenkonia sp. CL21]MDS2172938.1 monovalent cation/H+ antiporter complex subunit F [Nesterenkonia sp. CL21]
MLEHAYWITQTLLAAAVFCAVYRVFRGPSVLDRVISVDVILIIVSSMLITDMVARNHQDFILFVIATAVIGFLGAVAIARYVAVRRPEGAAGVTELTGLLPRVPEDPGSESGGSAGVATTARPAPSAASPSRISGSEGPDPHGGSFAPGGPGEDEDPSTSWFRELKRSGFTPRARSRRDEEGPSDQRSRPEDGGER